MTKSLWSRAAFRARRGILFSRKKICNCTTYQVNKGENWNIWCLQAFNLVARVRQLALRSPSPGRKIVLSFTTKYAIPRQNKPRILELRTKRSQSNSSIVLFFSQLRRKRLYCVISVGQLGFDCRSYCGHSHRRRQVKQVFPIFKLGGITKHTLEKGGSGLSPPPFQ